MITARYFDEARTLVELNDGNTTKLFPTSIRSPEWTALLRLVAAGEVAIEPYTPPAPPPAPPSS